MGKNIPMSVYDASTTMKSIVLIVDDEPANLSILNHILENEYQVIAAKSGTTALELLSKGSPPDIILLDIVMPEMDGYLTIQEIKKNPALRDIPVIFVSYLDNDMDEEYGFKLGAVDFINKPVKPAIVHARIHSHIELKINRDLLKKQNKWLEEEVQRQVQSNVLLQEANLAAIVGLVETRDTDTGNHILRTQSYVETLTNAIKDHRECRAELTRERIRLIPKASQLHDIGKIGIPDAILLKAGPLTEEEFKIMKTHAQIGGDILSRALHRTMNNLEDPSHCNTGALEFLEIAMVIATHHHEQWDGSGYPRGYAKRDIPLPARLMAVADVFDALTTKRVYKDPIPLDEAITIIQEGRGTRFDPLLVDALKDNYKNFSSIFHRFRDELPA